MRPAKLLLVLSVGLALTALAAPADAAPHRAKARAVAGKKSLKRPAKRRPIVVRVPTMRGNQPNVQALGAVVVDLDSGQELYGRKADQPRAIASISKLAAALVVLDRNLEMEGLTTIKKIDAEVARGGATSRLLEGMTLSNRDLLHAAMLGSDNRAVSALGRAVGLNATQFAEEMNRKVAKLGLKHTRFREPTGLSPENVSTPREAVQLLRAAMSHPVLGPILRRLEYDAHPVARPAIKYVNTHKPAHRGNTEVLGGKTGYNDLARYCLVLAARVDGRSYGMAFLGADGKMTRFGDVARVSDWLVLHKPAKAAPALAKTTPAAAVVPAVSAAPSTAVVPAAAPDAGAPADQI